MKINLTFYKLVFFLIKPEDKYVSSPCLFICSFVYNVFFYMQQYSYHQQLI